MPDGVSLLESIADPENRLVEAKEDNNCISVYIRLTGIATSSPQAQILGPGPSCNVLAH